MARAASMDALTTQGRFAITTASQAIARRRQPMLVGYVSDERYVALPDVLLEFENEHGSVETRSRATGAVYADVRPGAYKATLYKPGFGQKSVQMAVKENEPYQFRLLPDSL